jgi:hypothetical protein
LVDRIIGLFAIDLACRTQGRSDGAAVDGTAFRKYNLAGQRRRPSNLADDLAALAAVLLL